MMPVSVQLVRTAHVDLAFAAFFLSAVYFLLHAHLHGDRWSPLLGVASSSMLLGIKMSGVPYAAVLCISSICLLADQRQDRSDAVDRKQGRMPLLIIAVVASVTGLSWYIHNAAATGNPLGPVKVAFFGRVLWDGPVTAAFVKGDTLIHNFRPMDPTHWSIVSSELAAELSLPGLALVASSLGLPWALWRRRRDRVALFTVMGLAVACLYLYVSTPFSGDSQGSLG